MGKINSKAKGAKGERELASKLREYGVKDAKRSQQYCGLGENAADIVDALPNIHIECKRVERLNISDAIAQAKRDAKNGNMPTVFHRRNNEKWLVTMELSDWMDVYREYYSGLTLERRCK
jgi:Holliday junction resolvase